MRILHVSDLHGCKRCMRRVIELYKDLRADLLVFSGDISGKCVCADRCYCLWGSLEATSDFENRGGYKLEEGDPQRNLPGTLVKHAYKSSKEWVEELSKNDVEAVLIGGNLDHPYVDEAFYKYYPDPRNGIEFRGYTILGVDLTPYTPFGTFREASEAKIREMLVGKTCDILVSHTPPYGFVDLAMGKTHVGSKAILDYINDQNPILSLHGHIHESWGNERVGKTSVVNVGSQAYEGVLRYAVIDVEDKKVKDIKLLVDLHKH